MIALGAVTAIATVVAVPAPVRCLGVDLTVVWCSGCCLR